MHEQYPEILCSSATIARSARPSFIVALSPQLTISARQGQGRRTSARKKENEDPVLAEMVRPVTAQIALPARKGQDKSFTVALSPQLTITSRQGQEDKRNEEGK